MILDSGLNRWGTDSIISGAAIGTGTATPDAAQTALQTEVHFTTTTGTGHNTVVAAGASPYNNSRFFVYRTALGALNGNYSEVGVGWASGSMFSRALILDGLGSPTTISVSSVQQLDIEFELSLYPPLVDFEDTVSISGVNYDVTGRASNVNTTSNGNGWTAQTSAIAPLTLTGNFPVYNGAIGAITASNSGTGANNSSTTADSYVNNSLQRTCFASFGLTDGNVSGGIMSSRTQWQQLRYQYQFDPVIPKTGANSLVLNYSTSWARRP